MRQADIYLYDRLAGRLVEDETGYTFQASKWRKIGTNTGNSPFGHMRRRLFPFHGGFAAPGVSAVLVGEFPAWTGVQQFQKSAKRALELKKLAVHDVERETPMRLRLTRLRGSASGFPALVTQPFPLGVSAPPRTGGFELSRIPCRALRRRPSPTSRIVADALFRMIPRRSEFFAADSADRCFLLLHSILLFCGIR